MWTIISTLKKTKMIESNIPPANPMMRMPMGGMNMLAQSFPQALFKAGNMVINEQ